MDQTKQAKYPVIYLLLINTVLLVLLVGAFGWFIYDYTVFKAQVSQQVPVISEISENIEKVMKTQKGDRWQMSRIAVDLMFMKESLGIVSDQVFINHDGIHNTNMILLQGHP